MTMTPDDTLDADRPGSSTVGPRQPRFRTLAVVTIEHRIRATERRIADTYGLRLTERWVDIGHPAVRVRVQDGGEGDPIVYVNGLGAPGIGFAPLAGELRGHRHLLVDLPGHGLAPAYRWQGAPVREQAVAVLSGVLDALDLERATFVGNSLGGMFTLWLVLDATHRLARAVIIGEPAVALAGARATIGMALTTTPVLGEIVGSLSRMPAPRRAVRAGMVSAIGRHAAMALSDDLVDAHYLPVRMPGAGAATRSLLRRVIRGRTPRPENVLTDNELARITVPLLFIWGDEDVFLSPARGRHSVDKIPGAVFEVVPGAHDPWLDDAPGCGKLIAEFLRPDGTSGR